MIIKKRNILQVHAKMNFGGVESTAMNILRHIDRSKYAFVFLCIDSDKFDYEDEMVKLGVKVIRTPSPKDIGIIKYIVRIRKIMVNEQIDIVHAHSNMVLSLSAAISVGIKSRIAHSHTTGTENIPNTSKRIQLYISKVIINIFCNVRLACSEEAGKYLFGSKPFDTYYNGIILNDFTFSEFKRKKFRKEYGIPNTASVIGHIGRMVPVKNQNFLIEIFVEYLKLIPDAYLILIGEGYQQTQNELLAKKNDVEHRVIFLGSRGDVGYLYSAMDLFVFPSINEGLGMVIVEAQANGLKCLASDSVPSSVKLTEGVEFYSLSNDSRSWALRMSLINTKRYDAYEELEKGQYNINTGVKNIEKIYLKSLGEL